MARQHGTGQPAPGHRDGDDHWRGAIRRLARVTAMAWITAPLSSRTAAADCSLEAPAPGHRDRTIRCPASYPTRARECPSSEVWCQPAGARKSRGRMLLSGLGPAPPDYSMPPYSGLGCKGPERIFNGAAAMKRWKRSSATNEPCKGAETGTQLESITSCVPVSSLKKTGLSAIKVRERVRQRRRTTLDTPSKGRQKVQ